MADKLIESLNYPGYSFVVSIKIKILITWVYIGPIIYAIYTYMYLKTGTKTKKRYIACMKNKHLVINKF